MCRSILVLIVVLLSFNSAAGFAEGTQAKVRLAELRADIRVALDSCTTFFRRDYTTEVGCHERAFSALRNQVRTLDLIDFICGTSSKRSEDQGLCWQFGLNSVIAGNHETRYLRSNLASKQARNSFAAADEIAATCPLEEFTGSFGLESEGLKKMNDCQKAALKRQNRDWPQASRAPSLTAAFSEVSWICRDTASEFRDLCYQLGLSKMLKTKRLYDIYVSTCSSRQYGDEIAYCFHSVATKLGFFALVKKCDAVEEPFPYLNYISRRADCYKEAFKNPGGVELPSQ